ncbi:MAG: phytoene desaturase family protein, partial [Acutalibacteraceae bacterium]
MKVNIIGGGVAGLTCGIYLAANKIECEIFEKNDCVGGNLTGWSRGDCYIDNCMHWLTGTADGTKQNGIWRDIGVIDETSEIITPDPFYRCRTSEGCISLYRDIEKTRSEMLALSPADQTEINRFSDAVKKCCEIVTSNRPKISLAKELLRYSDMTLGELAERFSSPLIKSTLTEFIGAEFAASALIFAYAAVSSGNGGIPKGGSAAAANRIGTRFLTLGGRLNFGLEVTGTVIKKGRISKILLSDGSERGGDYFVFACDPRVSFSLMESAEMPLSLERMYRHPLQFPVYSAMQTAFSVPADADIPAGTTVFECSPYFADGRMKNFICARDYSYDDFASAGKKVLQTMTFVHQKEALYWINLEKDRKAYEKEKQAFAQTAKDRLCEGFGLSGDSVEPLDCWTPASYNRIFGSFCGDFIGFGMTPQSMLMSVPQRLRSVSNAYLASGWLSPPGGLPTAAKKG